MNKKILVFGAIFLFFVSALTSIVFGYNIKISDDQTIVEDYDSYYVNEITSYAPNIPCEYIKNNDMVKSNQHQIDILKETPNTLDGPMNSAWPMFQHDVRHTGRSPYGAQGDFGVVKWNINIGSIASSSPAINKNGTIYIGSNNWYFFAINSNGTEKWRYKTGGGVSSSPAIAEDGTIYVGSEDGKLYAFYPNGMKKWSQQVGDGWTKPSPVIDEDGIIYTGSSFGKNICAFHSNGTKKWDTKLGGMVYCSPCLDENGIVYIGSNDGYMYAIYTSNGTVKWKYKTGGKIGSAPTIGDDGIIYFGSNDGCLYALYPDGTLKWRFKAGGDALTSSPAINEDGTIYFGYHGGYIFSLDPDGKENWRYPTDREEVSASPAIDKNSIIYVGSWGGTFYALNPDGTARWKFHTGDYIFSSAAIGEDGTIYFSSWTGYLYAIEIIEIDNEPPLKPSIDGPTEGNIKTDYTYTAVATDPDGDDVSYFFDWGDGYYSDWLQFVPSGTSINMTHKWYLEDTYTIKVKAQDEYGADSEWATLTVTMPRNRAYINRPFFNFLDNHPILFQILQRFLNL